MVPDFAFSGTCSGSIGALTLASVAFSVSNAALSFDAQFLGLT